MAVRRIRYCVTTMLIVVGLAGVNWAWGEMKHDAYGVVLKKYVDDEGMVDYKKLKKGREGLDGYIKALGAVKAGDYKKWNDEAKIAFWVNAYNAITLQVVIDHYPISKSFWANLRGYAVGIRHISGAWDSKVHLVMGKKMSLEQIEHEVLRKEFDEPRIHMALVCAAMSCPKLRNEPYVGGRLEEQLKDQTEVFLQDEKKFEIDREAGKVYLSRIFDWFGEDFVKSYTPKEGFEGYGKKERAVLNFVGKHVGERERAFLEKGGYEIEYHKYDWGLNEQE